MIVFNLFGLLNFTRNAFSVLDHLWTQDSLIIALTVANKIAPYIDQGGSKLSVWIFQKKIKMVTSINFWAYGTWISVSRPLEPVLERTFHIESEIEVHLRYFWAPGSKIWENQKLAISKCSLHIPLYSLQKALYSPLNGQLGMSCRRCVN